MSPVIRIPQEIYSRLEGHAKGFDTPANVINRLLNAFEGIKEKKDEANPAAKMTRGRDTTKYLFEDRMYDKGRLVIAVISAYVADNPDTSFSELMGIFPKNLQGSLGVFGKESEAQGIVQRTGHKRHFTKPDELIELSDSVIAVSTEWDSGNIDKFIKQAELIGFNIVPKSV